MTFSDQFLEALGAWQNGWGTDQTRRKPLGSELLLASESLPLDFKTANGQTCYRKRFIHKGELEDIFVDDARDEDVASWTFSLEFARRFRGLKSHDERALTAAVFKCNPADEDVVVNIPALWKDLAFVAAAESYLKRQGPFARALFNFQGQSDQEEIVLIASLRGSDIIAVSAPVKTFDEYCDMMGIPDDHRRDVLFRLATEHGMAFGDMQYLNPERTARVSESAALTGHLVNAFNEILASC
jgi:hypothetical protein